MHISIALEETDHGHQLGLVYSHEITQTCFHKEALLTDTRSNLTITLPSALRATLSVQTTVLKVNNGVKISPRVASTMEEGPTSMLVWMR